ncbi:ArsR/SmtB family transcription factor [Pseudalkalibacillus caeni]|uniref:Winged helix-turn-helix transcriptional regulator n=1 Tax=Exobacillus caeni TaxID=2574798 RepID=A0A5R9F0V5_9BACL|nr:metalloregulator ArsR/SmtB family transcription factor [Pseudalkalibacillus caeni]TLS37187.1 winged helix-turn-helix transcriptional regulator [Pseudalkalibacillus caeni]
MDVFRSTGRKRETYNVEVKHSLLWECALGIAAITNSRLLETLEKPASFWKEAKVSFSTELLEQLEFVEKNNTWKALLQLLHEHDCTELQSFVSYITHLPENELKFICIPYSGSMFQETRKKAASGDTDAVNKLKHQLKENPFFPEYIEFICKIDPGKLKNHLIAVMTAWYKEFIEPNADALLSYLENDTEAKQKMKGKMGPEEFVEWATGGITYLPEPSVHNVLLIPHYIYRPWNVEADVEGTKVFYYPVANESISPGDRYTPNYFLVQKYKALGDEARLKIVKLLSEKSYSLQEMTGKLELGKSTVHHHLKILRSARIVESKNAKYSLKQHSIASLPEELEQYLSKQ